MKTLLHVALGLAVVFPAFAVDTFYGPQLFGPVKLKDGQGLRICASTLAAGEKMLVDVQFIDAATGNVLSPNSTPITLAAHQGACITGVQGKGQGQNSSNSFIIVLPSSDLTPAGIIAIIKGTSIQGGIMGPLDSHISSLFIVSGQIMDPSGPGQLLPAVNMSGKILPYIE